jgi:glutathione S-transferase/RNA polymerase-associated protein
MSAPLVLWEHPLSPFAQKVKIALREKGLAFETRFPTGIGSGGLGEAFAAISPFGEAPVLEDQGLVLFDSTIMLEYLEEAYPKPDLLPDNARLAAKARMIEEVMDTRYEAITWGLAEVTAFGRAEGAQAEAIMAAARSQLAGLHAWLDRQLGEADVFCRPHFGWADLAVAPFIAGAMRFGMGPVEGSRLSAWFERVSARETVRITFEEAEAASGGLALAKAAIASGRFKRQYRDHRLEWMMRVGGLDIVKAGLEAGTIRFGAELS